MLNEPDAPILPERALRPGIDRLHEDRFKIKIGTSIDFDAGTIALTRDMPGYDLARDTMTRVMQTEEAATRRALIALGWTPPDASDAVAIWSGEYRMYWRRDGKSRSGTGYTPNVHEAGIWTRQQAHDLTSHCGPEKAIALHARPGQSA